MKLIWRWLLDGSDRVSVRWLKDHDRSAWTRGIESVSWCWPVKKLLNENAAFNTSKSRREKARAA